MLLSIAALLPMFLLDFLDAFNVVIIILVFIGMYNMFYPEMLGSKVAAAFVTGTIVYLLVIPYDWFRYLMFVYFFMYAFFWQFEPWNWGKAPTEEEQKKEAEDHLKTTRGYPHHGVWD